MRHEDNVGYKMRLIHNRIHKQMEAKRIENEGNITGMQRWTLGFLNDRAGSTELYIRFGDLVYSSVVQIRKSIRKTLNRNLKCPVQRLRTCFS